MYYFEIKNTKTGDTYQGYGTGMRSIALQAGWKVKDCKSIYRAPKLGLDNLEAICYNERKKEIIKMKKMYRNTMRKVARFILGFERCPTDYKRSFMDDLWELFLKLFCIVTFVFLLMTMAVSWG